MITVIIPFFDQSSFRRRNLSAVVDNFFVNYPNFEVIIAEQLSDSTYIKDTLIPKYPSLNHVQVRVNSIRFNKSYILNKTIREHVQTEIIMMSDADCILPKINTDIFEEELQNHSVYFPFSCVNFLNEAHTRRYVKGFDIVQAARVQDLFINRYTGLINLFTRTTFDTVAGFDEEFEGWGGEDDAFIDKCNRLVSSIKRCEDDVELIHLYHPKSNTAEYMNTECFTWNKKRVATIRRMSDDELRSYVYSVLNGVYKPLEPIVKEYDAAGKLGLKVVLKLGGGNIAIDTTVYNVIPVNGEVSLREILQAVLDTDGVDYLKHIIGLIDINISSFTDDESIILDSFRKLYS